MSEIRYDGQVVVVTGAGGGLGKAYATFLSVPRAKNDAQDSPRSLLTIVIVVREAPASWSTTWADRSKAAMAEHPQECVKINHHIALCRAEC